MDKPLAMHVSLYVSNIHNTVQFYDRFFAQPATKVEPGYAKYEIAEPSLIISFVEKAEKVSPNFGHLGIRVATEAELAQRLGAVQLAGLQTVVEQGVSCCYAKQDKFWVQDPDGHHWEVYLFHDDVAFNDPRYSKDNGQPSEEVMAEANKQVVNFKPKADSCAPGGDCC